MFDNERFLAYIRDGIGPKKEYEVEELSTKYVHLQTPHGIAIGTFVVLVPGLLYIATGDVKRKGVRVKQGCGCVRPGQ